LLLSTSGEFRRRLLSNVVLVSLLFSFLSGSFVGIEAQAFAQEPPQTVILENFGGEGSFTDGYDFSERAAQRWLESGPDNPSLNPDFYLNEFASGIFGPLVHPYLRAQGWVRMVNYGQVSIDAVAAVPSQSDPSFLEQGFAVGYTYGLFTKEGNYVALHVNSQYPYNQIAYGDWYKNGIEFSWRFVSGGEPPPLQCDFSFTIYPQLQTVKQGETAQYTISLSMAPSCGGATPSFLVNGLGPGMTHYVQMPLLLVSTAYPGPGTYGTITPAGTYPLTVVGQALGIVRPYTITLIVEERPPTFDFEVTASPSTQMIDIGQALVAYSIAVTMTNGPPEIVSLSVAGLPACVTHSFSQPSGVPPFTTGLTIETSIACSPGEYTLEIRGSANQITRKAEVVLILSEKPDFTVTASPLTVTVVQGYKAVFKIEVKGTSSFNDVVQFMFADPIPGWVYSSCDFNPQSGRPPFTSVLTITTFTTTPAGNYTIRILGRSVQYYLDRDATVVLVVSTSSIPASAMPQIIDVVYPKEVKAGDRVKLTGKVVRIKNGVTEPLQGWRVNMALRIPEQWDRPVVEQNPTTTGMNGAFSFTFTVPKDCAGVYEIFIDTYDPEASDGYAREFSASHFDRIVVSINVDMRVLLEKTDYKKQENVYGRVEIRPKTGRITDHLARGVQFNPLIQLRGPKGNIKTYLVEDYGSNVDESKNSVTFYFGWWVPVTVEEGSYEVYAKILSAYLGMPEASGKFTVEKAVIPTVLSAEFLYNATDPWTMAFFVTGAYVDTLNNVPIADAKVTMVARPVEGESRSLQLNIVTNRDGWFTINLEQLNLMSNVNGTTWEIRISAGKEGYTTASKILKVQTPTINPFYFEIIEIEPSLNYLAEKMAKGEIATDSSVPLNIRLKVKYTALLDGGELYVGTYGFWSILPKNLKLDNRGSLLPGSTWTLDVSINGAGKLELGASPDKWFSYQKGHGYEDYEDFGSSQYLPLQRGVGMETEVTISGTLFNFQKLREILCPAPGSECSLWPIPQPEDPSSWRNNGVYIAMQIEQRDAQNKTQPKTGMQYACYPLAAPPTLSVLNGQAWVASDETSFEVDVAGKKVPLKAHGVAKGQAVQGNTRVPLVNRELRLGVLEYDSIDGKWSSSTLLSVKSTPKTDGLGWFVLLIELKGDLAKIDQTRTELYISVSSPGFQEHAGSRLKVTLYPRLDIELKVKEFHLIQVSELNKPYTLVSGKPAGVRAYVEAASNQPLAGPVAIVVQMTLLVAGAPGIVTGSRTQTIYVGPGSANTTQEADQDLSLQLATSATAHKGSQALTGGWKKYVPVDFLFYPTYDESSWKAKTAAPFNVMITVDPGHNFKRTGEETLRIEGNVMKTKQVALIFVPVNMQQIPEAFLLRQARLLQIFYPIPEPIAAGVQPAPPISVESPLILTGSWTFSGLQDRILEDLKDKLPEDTPDTTYRVVAVLDDKTWDASAVKSGWLPSTRQALKQSDGLYLTPWFQGWFGGWTPLAFVRYPNWDFVLSHEIGHSFLLYNSQEQYDEFPPDGKPIHGYVLGDGKIRFIPDNWDDARYSAWKDIFGKQVGRTIEVYDIMGRPTGNQLPWIWSDTYSTLLEKLKDPTVENVLRVEGRIHANGTVTLWPAWVKSGLADVKSEEGDYTLQLVASSGEVLYSTRFGETGLDFPFALRIPLTPGVAKIEILSGGEIVAEASRSTHPPTVQFSQLQEPTGSTLQVQWRAEDVDNDPLTYRLFYTCEGGRFWIPVAGGPAKTTYDLDLSQLPGGDSCTLKVMVTDGFNTAYAVSGAFSVPGKPPMAAILTEGTTYLEGETVFLDSAAYDLEDGFLQGDSLRWFSDKQGFLANGDHIEVVLSLGQHVITLEARDSSGMATNSTIVVTVESAKPPVDIWSLLKENWPIVGAGLAAIVVMALVLYRRKVRGAPQKQQITQKVAPAKPREHAFCENCGKQIDRGTKYCPFCGDKQGV